MPDPVFTKIIGHVKHFWWLGPNVWWEISQIWIEYKPIRQMSDEPRKFCGYTADPCFIITVSADTIAPNRARPSAGTVLTEKLYMFAFKFCWLSMILCYFCGPDVVIQNGCWNPAKSHGTLRVDMSWKRFVLEFGISEIWYTQYLGNCAADYCKYSQTLILCGIDFHLFTWFGRVQSTIFHH